MRTLALLAALLVVMTSTGCFWHHKQQVPPPAVVDLTRRAADTNASAAEKFVVAPDESLSGRVSSVNPNLRFAVLTFPLGQMPTLDSRMNVFRNGAIVGEIKVTGPQRDDNTVADIVLGDAQKGDEVRAK
jgi:hypothetical protein